MTLRHCGATMAHMKNSILKLAVTRTLERLNVRLHQETLEAIDSSRACRVGSVSRNTWIAEAIQEKLDRDINTNDQLGSGTYE